MTIPTFTSGAVLTAGELNTALADTASQAITDMVAAANTFAEVQTFDAASVGVNAAKADEYPVLGQTDSLYQSSALAVASTTTAGDVTASASDLAGQYLSDGATQTAAFTVTTDTAANILAAMPNAVVGSAFKFRFINNDQSSTGYAGTLAAGTGVTIGTILPNPAVGQGNWCDYIFTFTAVGSTPTITVEAVGGSSLGLL
jgi:hypothetical protein